MAKSATTIRHIVYLAAKPAKQAAACAGGICQYARRGALAARAPVPLPRRRGPTSRPFAPGWLPGLAWHRVRRTRQRARARDPISLACPLLTFTIWKSCCNGHKCHQQPVLAMPAPDYAPKKWFAKHGDEAVGKYHEHLAEKQKERDREKLEKFAAVPQVAALALLTEQRNIELQQQLKLASNEIVLAKQTVASAKQAHDVQVRLCQVLLIITTMITPSAGRGA